MDGDCTFKEGRRKGKEEKKNLWEKLSSSKEH